MSERTEEEGPSTSGYEYALLDPEGVLILITPTLFS